MKNGKMENDLDRAIGIRYPIRQQNQNQNTKSKSKNQNLMTNQECRKPASNEVHICRKPELRCFQTPSNGRVFNPPPHPVHKKNTHTHTHRYLKETLTLCAICRRRKRKHSRLSDAHSSVSATCRDR